MTTSGKGGVYSGQPVDITVRVVREAGGGGSASIPGNVSGMSSGQRNPPRSTQEPSLQGMPKGGSWVTILKGQRNQGGPEAPPKQASDISGMFALAKKWLPGLAGITTVAGIVSKSKLLGQTVGMIFDILGMIVDVLLMPLLIPLIYALMPLMPLLMKALNFYLNITNVKPGGPLDQALFGKEKDTWTSLSDSAQKTQKELNPERWKGRKVGEHEGSGSVVDVLNDSMVAAVNEVGKLGGSIVRGIFGKASGIGYVPNTMPAMLHRGERVLTAAENSGGSGSQMFNNKFDIHVANNVDASLLDARIADRLQTRLGSKYRRS